jgi:acetamidase/formamidase/AraC-like DNA-binding protein
MGEHGLQEQMELWNFSTAAFLEEDREEGWRRALESVQVSDARVLPSDRFFGIAAAITSPSETQYTYIASRGQSFTLPKVDKTTALFVHLIEGKCRFMPERREPACVISGDFVFGAPTQPVRVSCEDDLRMLILRMPRSILAPRLLAPIPEDLQVVSGGSGFAAVFNDMLISLSSKLGTISAEQFRTIETTLADFLAASLLHEGDTAMLGGISGRRAGMLHRISQTIERRLVEPELSLADIAEEHGMSVRNLQKLFEAFDKTFSIFVRSRRLERSREDLASPLCDQLSISEICFRWGFTDPAYFSRTFRDEFGVSPRDYRRAPHLHGPSEPTGRAFSRGRPSGGMEERSAQEDDLPGRDSADVGLDGGEPREHYLPVQANTVHWGYFSRFQKPALQVNSGDFVTIETLTHHAYDDYERMIKGDPGAEEVFHWTADEKTIDRRGAGPMDASACGRGAGEGFGVHICTGPIAVAGAKPGDILELRILSVAPRPSANPEFAGSAFGSNAAAFWGFHHKHLLTEPREREVITIYEVDCEPHDHQGGTRARAVYNYRWTPQTDPFGVVHSRIDYPGVPVDHSTIVKNFDVLRDIEIPVRPHFGVIGLAPNHGGLVDSVPPSSFGGNLDNWRLGAGSTVYLPVAVPGALLSIGDPHACQGDGEACGTAIECSLTGRFQIVLHRRSEMAGLPIADLNYPLIETDDEWVISGFSHPNYLEELGQNAQSDIYKKSSLDFAMRDAFRKVRRFLMGGFGLSEDEAISLISVAVDFGITQVADGNWGVHAVVRREMLRKRAATLGLGGLP